MHSVDNTRVHVLMGTYVHGYIHGYLCLCGYYCSRKGSNSVDVYLQIHVCTVSPANKAPLFVIHFKVQEGGHGWAYMRGLALIPRLYAHPILLYKQHTATVY